jgi:hypothetical protein
MTDAAPDPWTFRFTASGPRLAEALDNYRALGFDVRTEPPAGLAGGNRGSTCGECGTETAEGAVMAIFTRAAAGDADDPIDDEGDEG